MFEEASDAYVGVQWRDPNADKIREQRQGWAINNKKKSPTSNQKQGLKLI